MKKITLVLVVLLAAAPAMAVVTITATQVGTTADVDITATTSGEGTIPRAFALDITVDAGTIIDVKNYHTGESRGPGDRGFGIFPASFAREIDADDPNWADVNYTPVAEPNDLVSGTQLGIGFDGVTIEMGSLYTGPNAPPSPSLLCTITVSGSCNLSLALNIGRGNIVMEDGNEPASVDLIGTAVTVEEICTVPDVVDVLEADAITAIEAAGFVAGTPTYEKDDNIADGNVISTTPSAGAELDCGTTVEIVTSLGPCIVPDVVGWTSALAQTAIIAAGFDVNDITVEISETIADGNVISTDPPAGPASCNPASVNIQVSVGPGDLGDAPDGPYPTLMIGGRNGARHKAVGVMLGVSRDTEVPGWQSANCNGDDLAVTDDEDGVTNLWANLTGGTVDVNVTAACYLNAWIDFTDNGDWDDAGEQIFTNEPLTGGLNQLSFTVPVGVVEETYLISRWRVTDGSMAPSAYTGLELTGEVEDYNDLYVCRWDVDDNDFVNRQDRDAVIAYLNAHAGPPFWSVPCPDGTPEDVDGNNFVNRQDRDAVIAYLNANAGPPFWSVPCP